MSNFDERSGIVPCKTAWGSWSQTMEEVSLLVDVPAGTRSRDVRCTIQPRSIALSVGGTDVLKGALFKTIVPDESVWTLEDNKLLRIVLMKSDRDASSCWKSLLEGQYHCDPYVLDQMERKLTLERFQRENPGFDFSGAEISGNYTGGGPQFS